jgi:hypothetical protein
MRRNYDLLNEREIGQIVRVQSFTEKDAMDELKSVMVLQEGILACDHR